MRSAYRNKSTAHLVLGTTAVLFSLNQLDQQPLVLGWLVTAGLGLLVALLELPELARHEEQAPDPSRIADMRRQFEDHCRLGGWCDADLNLTGKGRYAHQVVDACWVHWQAKAEAAERAIR